MLLNRVTVSLDVCYIPCYIVPVICETQVQMG